MVLELTIAADAALPEDALRPGPWQVALHVRRWLAGLRRPAPAPRAAELHEATGATGATGATEATEPALTEPELRPREPVPPAPRHRDLS